MNVKVHLLNQGFREKPDKNTIIKISKTITETITEISIKELAIEVGENGKPFTPALFNGTRKNENFSCQQVYALDFDKGTTVSEFMTIAEEYGIRPAFVYATYSYKKDNERFRAVFVNDCIVEEYEASHILCQLLMGLFPNADSQCKDPARMFFGGIKLLYVDESAIVNIKDVAVALQTMILKTDRSHNKKRIEAIGNKLKIAVKNNILGIYQRKELDEIGEKNFLPSKYIIMGAKKNSPVFYVIERPPLALGQSAQNKPAGKINVKKADVKKENIINSCFLLQDFYKDDISHQHKFHLATSLVHIAGGRKLFFDCLKNNLEKWEITWKYIEIAGYKPQHCINGDCPYVRECKCISLYDKLIKKVCWIGAKEKTIPIQEAFGLLEECLENSVSKKNENIYLIKAQTSIGKTRAYCNLAEKGKLSKPLLIAVSTISLQKQVYNDLCSCGVSVYMTPNIQDAILDSGLKDLYEEVTDLYNKGFGYKVKSVISRYMKNHKGDLSECQKKILKDFLRKKQDLDGSRHVITTHKMLLNLPEGILSQYEIIVDEDILMSIFKNTASIYYDELKMVLNTGVLDAQSEDRINELMSLPDGSIGRTNLHVLNPSELDILMEKNICLCSSFPDFMASDTFCINAGEERIDYFRAQLIPKVKMIILSATLDYQLYKDFCNSRIIKYKEIPTVKYLGKLKQYTAYSMSRSCIRGHGFDKVLDKILSVVGRRDINQITFKKYTDNGDVYYGKTEGINKFKGQDLVVIGTPHNVPFIYQLIGEYLGYKADERMNVHTVENNGYRFNIMTFGDKNMRNLQFFFLESELEQAIGRARLLRFNCTVYLFSNFPCRQAEIIQDDYLN